MASKVCDGCNSSANTPTSVPYATFQSSMSRAERIIKRLIIALIVIIALTFASNIGWLIYANNNGNTSSNCTVTQSSNLTSIICAGRTYEQLALLHPRVYESA